jgi:hypothetical protein
MAFYDINDNMDLTAAEFLKYLINLLWQLHDDLLFLSPEQQEEKDKPAR